MNRYICNWLLSILPTSGFFKLKCWLCSKCNLKLSANVCINGHTWFYGRGLISIGESTWIGPRCSFYSDQSVTISIGKNCDIAPEVAFVVGSHEIGKGGRRAGRGYCQSIVVEDGCWIGARVTVLGGVTIGKGAVIGAGTLVTKDVPAHVLAVGVPARVVRVLDHH